MEEAHQYINSIILGLGGIVGVSAAIAIIYAIIKWYLYSDPNNEEPTVTPVVSRIVGVSLIVFAMASLTAWGPQLLTSFSEGSEQEQWAQGTGWMPPLPDGTPAPSTIGELFKVVSDEKNEEKGDQSPEAYQQKRDESFEEAGRLFNEGDVGGGIKSGLAGFGYAALNLGAMQEEFFFGEDAENAKAERREEYSNTRATQDQALGQQGNMEQRMFEARNNRAPTPEAQKKADETRRASAATDGYQKKQDTKIAGAGALADMEARK